MHKHSCCPTTQLDGKPLKKFKKYETYSIYCFSLLVSFQIITINCIPILTDLKTIFKGSQTNFYILFKTVQLYQSSVVRID